MRNKLLIGLLLACAVFPILFPMMGTDAVWAQANRTNSGDIDCPVSGSSIQILPFRNSRYSMVFNNTSAVAIRLGYLDSGTAALTNTTGWVLQPGQTTGDSVPGILNKRVVCMSTTAAIATITFNETYR